MTLTTKVGDDGILHLDLGTAQAGCDVKVTVESIAKRPAMTREEWHEFVRQTAGQWQGEFVRPPQGELQQRDSFQ